MRRIFFLFFSLISLIGVAQESIPQDTTLYLNGRKLVIKERDGEIKVKMYEAKTGNDTVKNVQVFEGVYLDGRSIERATTVSVPFMKKKKRSNYSFDPHNPFFYIGFDKLPGNTFQYSAKIPQIGSKSWEWGFNPFTGGVTITPDNHWGIAFALGFARIDYKLDDNYGFEKVEGVTVCRPASNGIEYSKSWLRYWAFRIPVSIEWQTRLGGRRTFLSVGPEVEFRTGIKSRAKYDGSKHTLSSNLNAHPLGLNFLMQAGYSRLGFIARFALTSLFEKDKGPELYPASLAIGWYL